MGLEGRRMAMNDHFLQRPIIAEERLTNPPEVAGGLAPKGSIGTHAGVGEEVITDLDKVLQAPQKLQMRGRDAGIQLLLSARPCCIIRVPAGRPYAVGQQGRPAAVGRPCGQWWVS